MLEDVDAVFKKAVQAGGKVIREVADQYYGDRSGGVEDVAGNQWWVATRKEKPFKRRDRRGSFSKERLGLWP